MVKLPVSIFDNIFLIALFKRPKNSTPVYLGLGCKNVKKRGRGFPKMLYRIRLYTLFFAPQAIYGNLKLGSQAGPGFPGSPFHWGVGALGKWVGGEWGEGEWENVGKLSKMICQNVNSARKAPTRCTVHTVQIPPSPSSSYPQDQCTVTTNVCHILIFSKTIWYW